MKFPRPTIKIGKCIAVVHSRRGRGNIQIGKPILNKRPGIMINGKIWKGSRLSYSLNVKKIPRNPKKKSLDSVLHTCDTDWCVNPTHLYLGTQADNVRDMYERNPTIRINLSIKGKGRKVSKKTRRLIAIANIGNKGRTGIPHSEEVKKRISESNKGQKRSNRTKARLRAAWVIRKRRMEKKNK